MFSLILYDNLGDVTTIGQANHISLKHGKLSVYLTNKIFGPRFNIEVKSIALSGRVSICDIGNGFELMIA